MKKTMLFLCILMLFGCARIRVETPEPIKLDINMRVDVYQHVVKDVESIEDQIYGGKEKQLNFIFEVKTAHAADYTGDVSAAIESRKKRVSVVEGYSRNGYIGENREARLEITGAEIPAELKKEIAKIVKEENKDRDIIYEAVAKKNGVDVVEIRKVFFGKHFKRAPSGGLFEVYDKEKEKYTWTKK